MKSAAARRTIAGLLAAGLLLSALACAPSTSPQPPSPEPEARSERTTPEPTTVFAIIGDYGSGDTHERAVAELVASWQPRFIVAVGDDYYASAGGAGKGKYDASTGAYYCAWLKGIAAGGKACPSGEATRNAFFPALGNHDYSDATPSPQTYLDYFDLPGAGFTNTSGNERYYDFVEGEVHFFVLNSNPDEPDGTSSVSRQAQWLRAQLAASRSTFNVVCDHHPPFSSDKVHGSTGFMQWPFAEWGADAVISGHAHDYERIASGSLVYFVNGLGGATKYAFGPPVAGSQLRYDADWGAQKVTVTESGMTFEFFNTAGQLVDSCEVRPH